MTTYKQLIEKFLAGETQGKSGVPSNYTNLRIEGEQLIHYWTPIAERNGRSILLNITRYSLATGKLQKQLKEIIPSEKLCEVKRVPQDYKGSLSDFIL